MRLDVFLQILRTLERFSTKVTFVRLQWNVDSDVGGDVVAFDGGCPARIPPTSEVEVVGTFSANMFLADVLLVEVLVFTRQS